MSVAYDPRVRTTYTNDVPKLRAALERQHPADDRLEQMLVVNPRDDHEKDDEQSGER